MHAPCLKMFNKKRKIAATYLHECNIETPKKQPNKVLHCNAVTDYHPCIFGHLIFQQCLVELVMWDDRMYVSCNVAFFK